MDSTINFFAGSELCVNVIPAFAVMSSSCGIGRPLHLVAFAPGGGGGGCGCPPCALASRAAKSKTIKTFAGLVQPFLFKGFSRKEYHGRGTGCGTLRSRGLPSALLPSSTVRRHPNGAVSAANHLCRMYQVAPAKNNIPNAISPKPIRDNCGGHTGLPDAGTSSWAETKLKSAFL